MESYCLIHCSRSTQAPSSLSSFVVHAPPSTDLWRKPATPASPPVESNNAPSLVRSIPGESFLSAQVTVSADWTRLYDQGGLVFYLPSTKPKAWVKAGIEFYSGRPNLSTVATPSQTTSDWSLLPLGSQEASVTLRVERELVDGKPGPSMWVYKVEPTGGKLAVREVTWALEAAGDMQVGVYAARPTKVGSDETGNDAEELVVHFSDFEITERMS